MKIKILHWRKVLETCHYFSPAAASFFFLSKFKVMQDASTALPKVSETAKGTQVVSARELHKYLQIKTQFTDWCKRMFDYGFTENQDYLLVTQKRVTNNPKNPFTMELDYALTLDTAKHISMVQRTPSGKEARQYFIDVEKRHNAPIPVLTPLELLEKQVQIAIQQQRRLEIVEHRIDQLEALGSTIPTGFLTISGYAAKSKIKVDNAMAGKLGKLASRKCLELGYITGSVHSEKFGSVKSYPIEALQMVFDEFFNGTPNRLSDIR